MKIISDFRDYYDSLMDPADKDRLFFRKTEKIAVNALSVLAKVSETLTARVLPAEHADLRCGTVGWLTPVLLLFCGQIYRGWQWRPDDDVSRHAYGYGKLRAPASEKHRRITEALARKVPSQTVWSQDRLQTLIQALEAAGIHIRLAPWREDTHHLETWTETTSVAPDARFRSEIIDANLSVAFLKWSNHTEKRGTLQPCLETLQFYRRLDIQQTFQELEQYLFGVLVEARTPQVQITDKEQVVRKGFDARYSFRTRPQA